MSEDRRNGLEADEGQDRIARFRELLRGRGSESSRRILEASDRLYAATARAAGATVPQEQLVTLIQALTSGVESFVFTLQEMDGVLGRAAKEIQPLANTTQRLLDVTSKVERQVGEFEARLGAIERTGKQVSEEVRLTTSGVFHDVGGRYRTLAERSLVVGILVALLAGGSLYYGRNVYDLLVAVTTRPAPTAQQTRDSGEGRRVERKPSRRERRP